MPSRITRLAPSPTGALHLGNARTFLINWALARQNNWKIILRIEDLDTPRVKPQAQQQAIEDLSWLGIDWDEGPLYQMNDLSPYRQAIEQLRDHGLIYACSCTRTAIEAAQSAPNLGDREVRYPGTCRTAKEGEGESQDGAKPQAAWRVRIPDEAVQFEDAIAGPQTIHVQQQVGDFVIATKAALPAYQLAVVVDDARQGVTDIVRGDDLIPSAARQLWLYRFLELTPLPRYWHLPLVIGEDGRRLAKRHGDTRLAWYRGQGVAAERIIGWIANTAGIGGPIKPMSAQDFANAFDVKRLPPETVVFTEQDHHWLMGE